MMLRMTVCCAALTLGLALTAAPALACEGAGCQKATKANPAKPLQLGKFMRPHGAKPAAHIAKARNGAHKQAAALGRRHKNPPPPVAEAPEPLPADAAAAFAAQPAPDVRVVESDELNEIDLAAGPAWPETNGVGRTAEDPVQVADATNYNDVDRKNDDLRPASLASAPGPLDEPARNQRASLTWIERFWGMVQHTFVALAAGWQYLFG